MVTRRHKSQRPHETWPRERPLKTSASRRRDPLERRTQERRPQTRTVPKVLHETCSAQRWDKTGTRRASAIPRANRSRFTFVGALSANRVDVIAPTHPIGVGHSADTVPANEGYVSSPGSPSLARPPPLGGTTRRRPRRRTAYPATASATQRVSKAQHQALHSTAEGSGVKRNLQSSIGGRFQFRRKPPTKGYVSLPGSKRNHNPVSSLPPSPAAIARVGA